ncbi:unnamed protein product [Brassica oleracea]
MLISQVLKEDMSVVKKVIDGDDFKKMLQDWSSTKVSRLKQDQWSNEVLLLLKRFSCRWSTEVRRFQRMVSSQRERVNREFVTGFVWSHGDWYLKKTKFQG